MSGGCSLNKPSADCCAAELLPNNAMHLGAVDVRIGRVNAINAHTGSVVVHARDGKLWASAPFNGTQEEWVILRGSPDVLWPGLINFIARQQPLCCCTRPEIGAFDERCVRCVAGFD